MHRQQVTTTAPGKLILSGEHAVVYGQPALATAVQRHVRAALVPGGDGIRLQVGEAAHRWTGAGLTAAARTWEARHERFLAGEVAIADVLDQPSDLLGYALVLAAREAGLAEVPPMTVQLSVGVPAGAGMGSSAAIGLALLAATLAAHGVEPTAERLYGLSVACERLQHGRPSGVDSWVCAHGGAVRFARGACQPVALAEGRHLATEGGRPFRACGDFALTPGALPRANEGRPYGPAGLLQEPQPVALPAMPFQLVHTGRPASTTGEAVTAVRALQYDGWERFGEVTTAMEQALARQDGPGLLAAIRENHRLLCGLGVVPTPVRQFIADIEAGGGAAKVCGAGASRGQAAGTVWVTGLAEDALAQLSDLFGYQSSTTTGDHDGTRVVARISAR